MQNQITGCFWTMTVKIWTYIFQNFVLNYHWAHDVISTRISSTVPILREYATRFWRKLLQVFHHNLRELLLSKQWCIFKMKLWLQASTGVIYTYIYLKALPKSRWAHNAYKTLVHAVVHITIGICTDLFKKLCSKRTQMPWIFADN